MKQCTKCKKIKEEKNFVIRNKLKGTLQPECRACTNEYRKKWYKKNTDIHKARVAKSSKQRFLNIKQYIMIAKDKPCADCHQSYPYYVMDFDHLPQFEKCFNISEFSDGRHSIDDVKAEIEKCGIVCANCHRIRTHKRGYNK